MTLGKAAAGVDCAGYGIYNIGFNGGDETQFTADNLQDLLECWIQFCVENGFQTNSVDYVERIDNDRVAYKKDCNRIQGQS